MGTRRDCLVAIATTGLALATGRRALAGEPAHDHSKAKILRGNPNLFDFGHGLIIPVGQGAFHTLWEGDDRWMAFGFGLARNPLAAMTRAEDSAIATMKLYLITLAFRPERMVRAEKSGWRLKSGHAEDLLRGDIRLPGRPVRPSVDSADSGGGGDPDDPLGGGGDGDLRATTYWRIWKSDVTLDYVRDNAAFPS